MGTMVPGHNRKLLAYLLTLRPHQWLKNALLLFPMFAGHVFDRPTLFVGLIALASFSLGASSVYIINDLVDRPHDCAHPEKRYRPIAAGTISPTQAIILFGFLAAASIALATLLPMAFMVALAVYGGLSLTYSFYLKSKLMIDVVALAA